MLQPQLLAGDVRIARTGITINCYAEIPILQVAEDPGCWAQWKISVVNCLEVLPLATIAAIDSEDQSSSFFHLRGYHAQVVLALHIDAGWFWIAALNVNVGLR